MPANLTPEYKGGRIPQGARPVHAVLGERRVTLTRRWELGGESAGAPQRDRPCTLRRGQTEEDVARLVHKDLVRSLEYARVWGRSGFDGHHVGREYALADGDMVELHG